MRQFIFSVLVVFISTGLAGAEEPGTSLLQISDQIRFSRDTVNVELSAERGTFWVLERSQDAEPSVGKGKKGKNIPLIAAGLGLLALGVGGAATSRETQTIVDPIFGFTFSETHTNRDKLGWSLVLATGGALMTMWGF